VGLAVPRLVVEGDAVRLDGDAALTFQVHGIQYLGLHLTFAKPPQIWMKRSARVDLPWSMWAMIEKLRIRLRSLTAGFFQRWFARHGGDRGVPPKTARKCTRFRYGTPSVPVCARARRPGHTPAE